MKKIIVSSAVMTLLLTSAHADFAFGDVFKDLKKMENSKGYTVKAPTTDFVFGDVFKDLKQTDNSKAYAVKAPSNDFVFGDLFKCLKNPVHS